MKTLILPISFMLFSFASFAQQKIDLSKDPAKPAANLPKSNAELLRESQEPGLQTEADLKEKYNDPDAINATGTSRTIQAIDAPPPPNIANPPVIMNKTTQQTNLGNGVKANTYIYHDNEGKARGSGTSFEFGKGKK